MWFISKNIDLRQWIEEYKDMYPPEVLDQVACHNLQFCFGEVESNTCPAHNLFREIVSICETLFFGIEGICWCEGEVDKGSTLVQNQTAGKPQKGDFPCFLDSSVPAWKPQAPHRSPRHSARPPTEHITLCNNLKFKSWTFTTYNGNDHFGAFGNGEVCAGHQIVLRAQSEGVRNWHHSQELIHNLWCALKKDMFIEI